MNDANGINVTISVKPFDQLWIPSLNRAEDPWIYRHLSARVRLLFCKMIVSRVEQIYESSWMSLLVHIDLSWILFRTKNILFAIGANMHEPEQRLRKDSSPGLQRNVTYYRMFASLSGPTSGHCGRLRVRHTPRLPFKCCDEDLRYSLLSSLTPSVTRYQL